MLFRSVNNILGDKVTITISSDPITLDVVVGNTEKVDVDGDGVYDLSVYLESISSSRANFVLTSISEDVVVSGEDVVGVDVPDGELIKDEDGVVEAGEDSGKGAFFWVPLIVVLLIVVAVFGKRYKK